MLKGLSTRKVSSAATIVAVIVVDGILLLRGQPRPTILDQTLIAALGTFFAPESKPKKAVHDEEKA
jgi:hypothetical protein